MGRTKGTPTSKQQHSVTVCQGSSSPDGCQWIYNKTPPPSRGSNRNTSNKEGGVLGNLNSVLEEELNSINQTEFMPPKVVRSQDVKKKKQKYNHGHHPSKALRQKKRRNAYGATVNEMKSPLKIAQSNQSHPFPGAYTATMAVSTTKSAVVPKNSTDDDDKNTTLDTSQSPDEDSKKPKKKVAMLKSIQATLRNELKQQPKERKEPTETKRQRQKMCQPVIIDISSDRDEEEDERDVHNDDSKYMERTDAIGNPDNKKEQSNTTELDNNKSRQPLHSKSTFSAGESMDTANKTVVTAEQVSLSIKNAPPPLRTSSIESSTEQQPQKQQQDKQQARQQQQKQPQQQQVQNQHTKPYKKQKLLPKKHGQHQDQQHQQHQQQQQKKKHLLAKKDRQQHEQQQQQKQHQGQKQQQKQQNVKGTSPSLQPKNSAKHVQPQNKNDKQQKQHQQQSSPGGSSTDSSSQTCSESDSSFDGEKNVLIENDNYNSSDNCNPRDNGNPSDNDSNKEPSKSSGIVNVLEEEQDYSVNDNKNNNNHGMDSYKDHALSKGEDANDDQSSSSSSMLQSQPPTSRSDTSLSSSSSSASKKSNSQLDALSPSASTSTTRAIVNTRSDLIINVDDEDIEDCGVLVNTSNNHGDDSSSDDADEPGSYMPVSMQSLFNKEVNETTTTLDETNENEPPLNKEMDASNDLNNFFVQESSLTSYDNTPDAMEHIRKQLSTSSIDDCDPSTPSSNDRSRLGNSFSGNSCNNSSTKTVSSNNFQTPSTLCSRDREEIDRQEDKGIIELCEESQGKNECDVEIIQPQMKNDGEVEIIQPQRIKDHLPNSNKNQSKNQQQAVTANENLTKNDTHKGVKRRRGEQSAASSNQSQSCFASPQNWAADAEKNKKKSNNDSIDEILDTIDDKEKKKKIPKKGRLILGSEAFSRKKYSTKCQGYTRQETPMSNNAQYAYLSDGENHSSTKIKPLPQRKKAKKGKPINPPGTNRSIDKDSNNYVRRNGGNNNNNTHNDKNSLGLTRRKSQRNRAVNTSRMIKPEVIELDDDESDSYDIDSNEIGQEYDVSDDYDEYDLVRIAIGKKIFDSGCYVLFRAGVLVLCFNKTKGQNNCADQLDIDLTSNEVKELKYYISEDDNNESSENENYNCNLKDKNDEKTDVRDNEEDDDEILPTNYVLLNIEPTVDSDLCRFSSCYRYDSTDHRRYILLEFRMDDEVLKFISCLKESEELKPLLDRSDSRISCTSGGVNDDTGAETYKAYARTLIDHSKKLKRQRLSCGLPNIKSPRSDTLNRNGNCGVTNRNYNDLNSMFPIPARMLDFIGGRNEDDTILVYPFDYDPIEIEKATSRFFNEMMNPKNDKRIDQYTGEGDSNASTNGEVDNGLDPNSQVVLSLTEKDTEANLRKRRRNSFDDENIGTKSNDGHGIVDDANRTDCDDNDLNDAKKSDTKFDAKQDTKGSNLSGQNRRHFLTIHVRDYERLAPGQFLNDTFVDFWMQWITRHDNSLNSQVHCFSSHFYTTLKEEGVSSVTKWTAKKGINVFKKKFIFIPVNQNLHWSLCVVVNPGKIMNQNNGQNTNKKNGNKNARSSNKNKNSKSSMSDHPGKKMMEKGDHVHNGDSGSDNDDSSDDISCMLLLDSLKAHGKAKIAANVRKWLNSEWTRISKLQHQQSSIPPTSTTPADGSQAEKYGTGIIPSNDAFRKDNFLIYEPKVPYQDNSWDCGVFVCRYAFSMYLLCDENFFRQDLAFIKNLSARPEFSFGVDHISELRFKMRVLVQILSNIYAKWKEDQDKKEKEAKKNQSRLKKIKRQQKEDENQMDELQQKGKHVEKPQQKEKQVEELQQKVQHVEEPQPKVKQVAELQHKEKQTEEPQRKENQTEDPQRKENQTDEPQRDEKPVQEPQDRKKIAKRTGFFMNSPLKTNKANFGDVSEGSDSISERSSNPKKQNTCYDQVEQIDDLVEDHNLYKYPDDSAIPVPSASI